MALKRSIPYNWSLTGYSGTNYSATVDGRLTGHGLYGLISEKGRGTYGVVYKAVVVEKGAFDGAPNVGEIVALKAVSVGSGLDEIKKEVQNLAKLKYDKACSPGIVCIYGSFPVGSNLLYIIMEYIDGVSLHDWAHSGKFATMSDIDRMRLAQLLIKPVMYMHSKNIVHRDIKPGNIMILPNLDRIVYVDYGLSCEVKCTGSASGTIPFSHPALVSSIQFGSSDKKSFIYWKMQDKYGLAASLFYLLYQRHPNSTFFSQTQTYTIEFAEQNGSMYNTLVNTLLSDWLVPYSDIKWTDINEFVIWALTSKKTQYGGGKKKKIKRK